VGKTNFFSGEVVDVSGPRISVKTESGQVFVGNQSKSAPALAIKSKASVAVRPEMISICTAEQTIKSTNVTIQGQVMNRIFLGEHSEYLIATEGYGDLMVLSPKAIESDSSSFAPGEHVSISWGPEEALVLEDT